MSDPYYSQYSQSQKQKYSSSTTSSQPRENANTDSESTSEINLDENRQYLKRITLVDNFWSVHPVLWVNMHWNKEISNPLDPGLNYVFREHIWNAVSYREVEGSGGARMYSLLLFPPKHSYIVSSKFEDVKKMLSSMGLSLGPASTNLSLQDAQRGLIPTSGMAFSHLLTTLRNSNFEAELARAAAAGRVLSVKDLAYFYLYDKFMLANTVGSVAGSSKDRIDLNYNGKPVQYETHWASQAPLNQYLASMPPKVRKMKDFMRTAFSDVIILRTSDICPPLRMYTFGSGFPARVTSNNRQWFLYKSIYDSNKQGMPWTCYFGRVV